jgi:hypothetical protein
MADLYVQVATDGAGKKIQTYENAVNAQTVEAQAVVPVTTAGTPIPLVDNAAFTDGTTGVVPAGFIFDETAGTALTENDAGAARMDSKRALVGVIEDATTRGTRARVLAASTAVAAADPALVVAVSPNQGVALGNTIGKTLTMKTGTLASSATTADQVVLTYTVTTGKTFFVEYLEVMARLTTFATPATLFGTVSLELPSGTKVWTTELVSSGTQNNVVLHFSDPIFATSTQVIRVVCTPSAATAFTWRASFGGYER